MIFRDTVIPGVRIVVPERHDDARGFFARTWDAEEFARAGMAEFFVQASISYSRVTGTLRGMHYQVHPHEETKLVRCTTGSIYDVVVDLRPESSAFGRWVGIELSAENRLAMYISEGCAHGFLTLADHTEVAYQISAPHVPAAARGVRYDDPAFGIEWPGAVVVVNERDASYPDFAPDSGRDAP